MDDEKLQQSPHWDEREGWNRWYHGQGAFYEGFPARHVERTFTLILRNGERIEGAHVDLSTQWRAEGLTWSDGGRYVHDAMVAAWKEEPKKSK